MKNSYPLPTISILAPPDSLLALPTNNFHKRQESFVSDSYNSSVDPSIDPEVQQIIDITQALDRGIKTKLHSYRKITEDLSQGLIALKQKVHSCTQELVIVRTSVTDLVNETSETHKFVKNLREKESCSQTEEFPTSQSSNVVNISDALNKMKEEIEEMKQKMEAKESEFIKSSSELQASYHFERTCRRTNVKPEFCSCTSF